MSVLDYLLVVRVCHSLTRKKLISLRELPAKNNLSRSRLVGVFPKSVGGRSGASVYIADKRRPLVGPRRGWKELVAHALQQCLPALMLKHVLRSKAALLLKVGAEARRIVCATGSENDILGGQKASATKGIPGASLSIVALIGSSQIKETM